MGLRTKKIGPICLLFLALPMAVQARHRHDSDAMKEFKEERACPSTGMTGKGACPGYTVAYFKPLCAGGTDTKDNMVWMRVEDARAIERSQGPGCANLRDSSPLGQPLY